jgi:hypothetical protein
LERRGVKKKSVGTGKIIGIELLYICSPIGCNSAGKFVASVWIQHRKNKGMRRERDTHTHKGRFPSQEVGPLVSFPPKFPWIHASHENLKVNFMGI